MRATTALRSGLREVWRSLRFAFWLYLACLASAAPLAVKMREVLRHALGSSLVQENLRTGFDMSWYGEFSHRSSGLAESFGPWIVGFLPPVVHLERLLDGQLFEVDPTILMAALVYLLVWMFLGGGVIARYTGREDAQGTGEFLAQCGRYFLPFARLFVLSAMMYLALFRWAVPPLFELLENWTRDVTVERTVLLSTLGIYALAGALFVILACAADYAKIAMVVEKRRSSVLALLRGLKFIVGRPATTLGLYLSLLAAGVLLFLLYYQVAPGPEQSGPASAILAFALSQVFLFSRIALKLWFLASQASLFTAFPPGEIPVPMPGKPAEPAEEGLLV